VHLEWFVCLDFLIFVMRTVSRAPEGIFSGGMSEIFLTTPDPMPLVPFFFLSGMDASFSSDTTVFDFDFFCPKR